MYGDIVFYTHGSTVEYGGEIFPAGELTADILNFTPEDYPPIQHLLDRMKNLAKQYEDTLDRGIWWELNNQFIELRSQLMRYRVFRILLQEDEQFLNETQQYTENASLFTDEEMDEQDCSAERLLEMHRQKEEGRTPPFLLIVAGNRNDKWRYYKLQMARYRRYIEDIIVFNPTIHNFINFLLSKLKRNAPEEYAAALYQFYNDERLVEKLIVNPTSLDRTFYQKYDPCEVSYLPRELPDGTFAIAQEHTTDSLQMLLKADFMTALNAGHNIRRCIVCKRYFLVRSGVHVLYCEGRCPSDERFTCRQFGSYEIQKELAQDVPKIKAKMTAFARIRKDYQRGAITEEEMRQLKDAVRDKLFDALSRPDISNEDFKESISSEQLYPIFGITRQAKPRGRPRKMKDGDSA